MCRHMCRITNFKRADAHRLNGDSYETQGIQKAITVLDTRNGPGWDDITMLHILDR